LASTLACPRDYVNTALRLFRNPEYKQNCGLALLTDVSRSNVSFIVTFIPALLFSVTDKSFDVAVR
jgi:hypothetical protein